MEQNKAQYDLDTQIARILAWSSGNLEKYQFLTGKNVLLEKDLLEKAKRVEKRNWHCKKSSIKY